MTVNLPDLSNRKPELKWLKDALPERIEPQWLREQYQIIIDAAKNAGNDADKWIEIIKRTSELEAFVDSQYTKASVSAHQATDDEDVQKELTRWYHEVSPVQQDIGLELARIIQNSPSRSEIDSEFGSQYLRVIDGVCRSNDVSNTALRTKVSDLSNKHSQIFGAATITWRGEEFPFSYLRKSALDEDKTERHKAWESMTKSVQKVQADLEDIYDEMMQARFQMAHNLGFNSYIEMRYLEMGRFDWDENDAFNVRSAIREHVVPLAKEMQLKQAEYHGSKLLHPADSAIHETPSPKMRVGIDKQLETAQLAFDELGESFSAPFRMMVNEKLIDLEARSGKSTGAFCTAFPFEGVPFVCCNSVGSHDDVRTLVHEFGHALQVWRSRNIEPIDLRWPTLEACEIHSMSLELLAQPHLNAFFETEEDFRNYCNESITHDFIFMPYMAAIDEFQHRVYNEKLDRDGRADAWQEVAKIYQPAIDWEANEWYGKSRWILQNHLFGSPFYYLDYALAQLVAWQLWLDSIDDSSNAITRYLTLCSEGGTKPFRQLVLEAGLRDPFDPQVIKDTVARLKKHL